MCCAVVASLGVWTGTDGNILSPFTLFSHIFSMPQACAKRYYYKYTVDLQSYDFRKYFKNNAQCQRRTSREIAFWLEMSIKLINSASGI